MNGPTDDAQMSVNAGQQNWGYVMQQNEMNYQYPQEVDQMGYQSVYNTQQQNANQEMYEYYQQSISDRNQSYINSQQISSEQGNFMPELPQQQMFDETNQINPNYYNDGDFGYQQSSQYSYLNSIDSYDDMQNSTSSMSSRQTISSPPNQYIDFSQHQSLQQQSNFRPPPPPKFNQTQMNPNFPQATYDVPTIGAFEPPRKSQNIFEAPNSSQHVPFQSPSQFYKQNAQNQRNPQSINYPSASNFSQNQAKNYIPPKPIQVELQNPNKKTSISQSMKKDYQLTSKPEIKVLDPQPQQSPYGNKKGFNVPVGLQVGSSTFQPPPIKKGKKQQPPPPNQTGIVVSRNQQKDIHIGQKGNITITSDQKSNFSGKKVLIGQTKTNDFITSKSLIKPKEISTVTTYQPGTSIETKNGVKLTVGGQSIPLTPEQTAGLSVNIPNKQNKQFEVIKNPPNQTRVQDLSSNKGKKNFMLGNKTTDDKPIIIQRMKEEDKDKIILDVIENDEPLSVFQNGKSFVINKQSNDTDFDQKKQKQETEKEEEDSNVVESMLDVYNTLTKQTEIVDIPIGKPEVSLPVKGAPLDLGKKDPTKKTSPKSKKNGKSSPKQKKSHVISSESEEEDLFPFMADDEIDPLTDMINLNHNIPDDMKDLISEVSDCFLNDTDPKTGLPNDMVQEMIEVGDDEIMEEGTRVIKNFQIKVNRKPTSKTPSPPPLEPIFSETKEKAVDSNETQKRIPLSPVKSNPQISALSGSKDDLINSIPAHQIQESTEKLLKLQEQTQEAMQQLQEQQQKIQEQMAELQKVVQTQQPVETLFQRMSSEEKQQMMALLQQQHINEQKQQFLDYDQYQQFLQNQQILLNQAQQQQFHVFEQQQREIQMLQQQGTNHAKKEIILDPKVKPKEVIIPEKKSITLANKSKEKSSDKIIDSQTGFTVERRKDLNLLITDISKPKEKEQNLQNQENQENESKGITIGAEGITLLSGEKIAHKTRSFNFDPNEVSHDEQGVAILANGITTTPKITNFDYKPISSEYNTFQPPRALASFAKNSIFQEHQPEPEENDFNVLKPPPEAAGTIFQPPKDYAKEKEEKERKEAEEKAKKEENEHEEEIPEKEEEQEAPTAFFMPISQFQLHPDQFNQQMPNPAEQFSYLQQHGPMIPIVTSINEEEEKAENENEKSEKTEKTEKKENNQSKEEIGEKEENEISKEQEKAEEKSEKEKIVDSIFKKEEPRVPYNSLSNQNHPKIVSKLDGSDLKEESFLEPESFSFPSFSEQQKPLNPSNSVSNSPKPVNDLPVWNSFGMSALGLDSSSGPDNIIINETVPKYEEKETENSPIAHENENEEGKIIIEQKDEEIIDPSILNKQEILRKRKEKEENSSESEEEKQSSSGDGIYYRRDEKNEKKSQTISLNEEKKQKKTKKKVHMSTVVIVIGICALIAVILGVLSFYIVP